MLNETAKTNVRRGLRETEYPSLVPVRKMESQKGAEPSGVTPRQMSKQYEVSTCITYIKLAFLLKIVSIEIIFKRN